MLAGPPPPRPPERSPFPIVLFPPKRHLESKEIYAHIATRVLHPSRYKSKDGPRPCLQMPQCGFSFCAVVCLFVTLTNWSCRVAMNPGPRSIYRQHPVWEWEAMHIGTNPSFSLVFFCTAPSTTSCCCSLRLLRAAAALGHPQASIKALELTSSAFCF